VAAYNPTAVLRGQGPFLWAALSGEASDIGSDGSTGALNVSADNHLIAGIKIARSAVKFPGRRLRICWHWIWRGGTIFGFALNWLVSKGKSQSPGGWAANHLDSGRLLRRIANVICCGRVGSICELAAAEPWIIRPIGASWGSIHNGGGL